MKHSPRTSDRFSLAAWLGFSCFNGHRKPLKQISARHLLTSGDPCERVVVTCRLGSDEAPLAAPSHSVKLFD